MKQRASPPTIRIIPIVYDGLPEPDRYFELCRNIAKSMDEYELFRRCGVRTLFDESLTQFSRYLIEDVIPPKQTRYNATDGWLSVDSPIRWRLEQFTTTEPVAKGDSLRYPGFDKDDILLAIIPASVQTTPEIWVQECHFQTNGAFFGSPLKTLLVVYHARLVNERGDEVESLFKELNPDNLVGGIITDIAREHLGIRDPQMALIGIKFGYGVAGNPQDDKLKQKLRVLFYGSDICSPLAIKRAMLLFDDLHFHDRPGYFFGDWGGIGSASRVRRYAYGFASEGVPVLVHDPAPSLYYGNMLEQSVAADLEDPRFSSLFFEGIRDQDFRNLFIHDESDYVEGKGREISDAMMKLDLGGKPYDLAKYKKCTVKPFDPKSVVSLEQTFVQLLAGASVHVSLGCLLAHQYSLIPFTEHPTFERLVALRTQRIADREAAKEPGWSARLSFVSFKLFQSVVPDHLLGAASFKDVISYRHAASDSYNNFRAYLLKIDSRLESEAWNPSLKDELDRLIAQEVIPEALRFQAECKRIWEKMFGEIVKAAVKRASQVASAGLALSCFTGLSWFDLFVKGCAVAAPLVVPPVLDYRRENKEIRRQNALSYLLDFRAAR